MPRVGVGGIGGSAPDLLWRPGLSCLIPVWPSVARSVVGVAQMECFGLYGPLGLGRRLSGG